MPSVPTWRSQLDVALAAAPIHKDFCMATAAAHGNTPRVRHVTHQFISPSNFIVVGTDRASGKVCDVEEHPQVEVAWFIPPYQFRIRGTAVVIGEAGEFARAAQHLGASVDTPEGTYHYWRTKKEEIFNSLPGAMTQRYDHAPPRGAHPPAGVDNKHYNFVLIALVPKRVEVLDLLDKGYTTYVLTDKGWVEEPAAPVIKERAHI